MLNTKLLGSVSAAPSEFVEDVFSTYLYTGNGSTQTITNGIDLAGKGGMVWVKGRLVAGGGSNNRLTDTVRGATNYLTSNSTLAATIESNTLTSFNSNGFSVGNNANFNFATDATYCSWTFRKAEKFFDIVTWTGNSSSSNAIAHSLGSQPGMIMIKATSTTSGWDTYARNGSTTYAFLRLNETSAAYSTTVSQTSAASSTNLNVGWLSANVNGVNDSGVTYVAYLFAHDAGGFGAAGTDNVISCGSYTGNGSTTGPVITLGYEPQYVLIKRTDSSTNANWYIYDVMRGMPVSGSTQTLYANASFSEDATSVPVVTPTATGFQLTTTATGQNASGGTYIYMAIRRPMKPPTSGTQVFSPNTETSSTSPQTVTTGFPVDLCINTLRNGGFASTPVMDRLRGGTTTSYNFLTTTTTAAEATGTGAGLGFDSNIGLIDNAWLTNTNAILWNFRRATGFFDVVCYTGTGSAVTFNHNLGVAPELLIFKRRDAAASWRVQSSALTSVTDSVLILNANSAEDNSTANFYTTPTSTTFGFGTGAPTSTGINASGSTYVAYLFATVAGVSKVFSFTGNGSSQTINCGFTAGARLVLIKRTDSTGDWYIWDTARGIVSGNDPHLSLNTTAAEVTSNDSIDPDNSGFVVNQLAATNINVSSATYIGIAIA